MLKSRSVLLAKLEATYGIDAVPVPATDAIFCEEPSVEEVTRSIDRNHAQPHFGARVPFNIGEALKITFRTELAGSGEAGTAPQLSPLFRAANFTETIVPGVSVAYDPNSADTDGESITIYYYQGGRLYKAVGCRGGAINLEAKAGELAIISWEFQGLYAGPIDAVLPAPTFIQPKPPRFISASFDIDGYAAVIETFKVSIANEIGKRTDANSATGILEYFIKGRKASAEIDPEAVLIATKDFHTMWQDAQQVVMNATIGSTVGNKCAISAPKAVLESPKDGDREGLMTQAMSLRLTPDSGNDEIQFLFN